MTCLRTRLARRVFALAATVVSAVSAAACSEAQAGTAPKLGVSEQALGFEDVAAACGLACPGGKDDNNVTIKGIADGNARISGVASVDAFFGSVVNFQAAATGVTAGIKARLDEIRGDFGIAGDADLAVELKKQFDANLEGAVEFKTEPARCSADLDATFKAKARCEGEVNPGKVEVECKGSCEMDVSAEVKCDADVELQCTVVPPDLKCQGGCQGTCTAQFMAAASCTGSCRGSCSGNCDAYVKNTMGQAECAGRCDGMCTGSCDTEFAAAAQCDGQCKGECTLTNPEAGCKGAVRAECKAKADASVKCEGKCRGDFEPPSAKVECQASAKAEAKLNVQCTPPRVSLSYKLKATGTAEAELIARAQFEARLKTLINVRLPALKAELARGESVASAAADLTAAASGAVRGGFEAAQKGSVKVQFGLGCALNELPKVKTVIDAKLGGLKAQQDAAAKITGMLKV